jgi:hypothetical protein
MRYIFITLITANVLIFGFLLFSEHNEVKKQRSLNLDSNVNFQTDLREQTIERPLDATKNIQVVKEGLAQDQNTQNILSTIRSANIEVDTIEKSISSSVGNNEKSIKDEDIADEDLSLNNANMQSKVAYKCIKVTSELKENLLTFFKQNNYAAKINTTIVSKPAFKTLFIPAISKVEANTTKRDLVSRDIIKDAYVTKISGNYAVSLGVFSKEEGIQMLKLKLEKQGFVNLSTKQGYREYETYDTYLDMTEEDYYLLEKRTKNEQIKLNIENNEKKCIL